MYREHTISLVIPCYNEAQGLRLVLPRVPRWIDEVLVIDNNSQDHTLMVAKKHGAKTVTEKKQGYGSAIKKGFQLAQGDIIALLDGDGQHNPLEVRTLLDALCGEELDFVSATRFPLQAGSRVSRARYFGNWMQTLAFNLLFRTNIADSQSGMLVFKKQKVLAHLPLGRMSDGMAFSEELKARVIRAGFSFREVPVVIKQRQYGGGKLAALPDGIRNLKRLVELYYELRG